MPRFLVEIQEVKPGKGGGCLHNLLLFILGAITLIFALGIVMALVSK